MSRFKDKGGKSTPPISTASLPDIIFMLLFFFMVTTVMREVDLKVKVVLPEANEVAKLEDKALVDYLYIGPPADKARGTEPLLQLNDDFATLSEIDAFVVAGNERRDEVLRGKITRSLKVDKDTYMKFVTDVKQELRKSNALKINYSTSRGRCAKQLYRNGRLSAAVLHSWSLESAQRIHIPPPQRTHRAAQSMAPNPSSANHLRLGFRKR